ncbi:alanine:cation symporter family protein [Bacillus pumilus]|nr:alanine:cation symporter family protein [Bacillus pumilus]
MGIGMGGAGGIFWMWMVGIIGCGSRFVERRVGEVYKVKDGWGFGGGGG